MQKKRKIEKAEKYSGFYDLPLDIFRGGNLHLVFIAHSESK